MLILLVLSTDVFAGKEKVYSLLEKHGARYLDDLFRYLGLMGLLAFMKAVSWSKMLFGGFLSIVGAFYPNSKNQKDTGEAHIEVSKIKLYAKGTVKFMLIIVGAILIIGSVVDGFNKKNDYYPNGYIGIKLKYIPSDACLLITDVLDDSPAQESGLKSGDQIVRINNISVKGKSRIDIGNLIKGKANTSVSLEIVRDGKCKVYVLQRKYMDVIMTYC